MQRGAIILCGGNSTRMGRDKASLPFGPESMLHRVARLIGETIPLENIVLVARRGQDLPPLPSTIRVVYDERPDRGPLEGLAAGLRAVSPAIDVVFVTSCDVPLLVPQFVEQMFERLGECDIAVPRDALHHPLAAVYRTQTLAAVERLLEAGRFGPRHLFGQVRTVEVPVDLLRAVDPELRTLFNVNCESDYRAALAAANLEDDRDPGAP